MYRNGRIYDEIDKTIIDIYLDYNIHSFPINETEICNKLAVALVPYSAFSNDSKSLLCKKSKQGFFVKESRTHPPTIYYNDAIGSFGSIRFTIFHELKHYIYNDPDDSDDDLADHFSRHFMCPTAYIMMKGLNSPNEIISYCGMSLNAACQAYSGIANRIRKYGQNLFDYEIPLIEHLDPVLLETRKYKIIQKEGDIPENKNIDKN